MTETVTLQFRPAVRSPAEVYDEQFVPALFRPWGPVMCDAVCIGPGQRVLDVACGTGALTQAVADRAVCDALEHSPGYAALAALLERLFGTASIDALVSTERACAWTLDGLLDEAQFEQLRREAQHVFRPFVQGDGMLRSRCRHC